MRSLLSALYEHAAAAPMRPALLFVKHNGYRQFTYEDLLRESERWARIFANLEVELGQIVAIVLDHRYELYPAFLGAMRAGAIPTFLPYPTSKQDPDLYWRGQAELFARVRPACVLAHAAILPRIAELTAGFACALVDVDELVSSDGGALPPLEAIESHDRIALLQHSSGTTGAKKGVALTFGTIADQNAAHAAALEASPGDLTVSWLPLYHDMGLIAAFLFPISLGSCVVSLDAFEWLLRPASLFEAIEHYRASHTWLPNFAFNHLVRTHDPARSYDLSSMRAFVNCSEPCKPATFDGFATAFAGCGVTRAMLRTCYAMAETVFAVTLSEARREPRTLALDPEALRTRDEAVTPLGEGLEFLSCGKPLDGLELRIAAQSGANVGEIQLRGRFVFSEYYGNPDATAQSFEGGWYKTGDLGFLYEGELYVCGRRKEMLIVHGQNFYASDVEAVAGEVAGVKPGRVAVFAVFDASAGSEEAIVLAETELDDEASRLDLIRRIRADVYSRLGLQVRTVELRAPGELVKTTSGKMSRDENLRRYVAAAGSVP
jgi:acyl-CoA synthetase (AMP-forming)/AMP-acid ligase II